MTGVDGDGLALKTLGQAVGLTAGVGRNGRSLVLDEVVFAGVVVLAGGVHVEVGFEAGFDAVLLPLAVLHWLHCLTLPDLSLMSMTTRLEPFVPVAPGSVKTLTSFLVTAWGTLMVTSVPADRDDNVTRDTTLLFGLYVLSTFLPILVLGRVTNTYSPELSM